MPPERPKGPLLVEAGLCLFAASLPLSIAGANIGWALAAAGLALCRFEGVPVRWDGWRSPLFAPLAAYVGVAAIAALHSPDAPTAWSILRKDAHKLWLLWLLVAAFSTRPSGRWWRWLAAGAAASAILGIVQSVTGIYTGDFPRAHAFTHAVTYGEQMAALTLLFAAMLCHPSEETLPRPVSWCCATLCATALILSNTRGAQIAAAIGALCLAFAVPKARRSALAVTGIGALAAVGFDLLTPTRSIILTLVGFVPAPDFARGQFARVLLWEGAWRMGLDHPVAGVGLGGYRAMLPSYAPPGTLFEGMEATVGNAHNLYLHHFAERGILGLCALAWLLWTYSAVALRRMTARPGALTLWSLTAAAAFIAMNITEVALQTELVWMMALFAWCAAETAD